MYTNESIKFCRVDVAIFDKIAQKYSISTDPMSKQIPTLMMLENGKEMDRFPPLPKPGKAQIVPVYNEKNIVKYLEIDHKFYTTSAK